MVNSLLCTCSQLHKPRFCMKLLTETTPIRQVRTSISIVRYMVNKSRNNLITNITIHLNDKCLVSCLLVVHGCIDTCNTLTNIPNSLRLLCTIYVRPTTLFLWKISLKVLLSTRPTLQLTSTNTSMSLLRLMSLPSYIKSLLWCHILFLIGMFRPYSLRLPFTFTFFFSLPSLLRFILTLSLFIEMLQFPNDFLK